MKLLTMLISISLLVFFAACGGEKQTETQSAQEQKQEHAMESGESHMMADSTSAHMVVDPVCGMTINKEDAVASVNYKGETYYFCMQADKESFEKDPEQYVNTEQKDSKMDM